MQAERGHGAALSRGHCAGIGDKKIGADPAGNLFQETCLAGTTGPNEYGWTSGPRLQPTLVVRSGDHWARDVKPFMSADR